MLLSEISYRTREGALFSSGQWCEIHRIRDDLECDTVRFVFPRCAKNTRPTNDARDKCVQRAPVVRLFLFIVRELFAWLLAVEFRIVVYVIDVEGVLRERERERE